MTVRSENNGRGVLSIIFDRAEAHNALNAEMSFALDNALNEAGDPAVRVVVLRAKGKNFCAGADVKEQSAGNPDPTMPSLSALKDRLDVLPKPTIALVQGACIGAGVAFIAACDIVIAEPGAFFSIPEVRLGFIPAALLPGLDASIGARNVRRYGLTGERIDAETAARIGLVHELCDRGGLEDAVTPVLEAILLGGPEAIAHTKALIRDVGAASLSGEMAETLTAKSEASRASAEAVEGRASFVEKRKPKWVIG